MERREKVELDVAIGSSGYFVREASSGLVVGPKRCKDGVPRKITVPIDKETGEVRNIHMKSGRGRNTPEDWRIYPQEVLPNIASWIGENSSFLAPSEVRGLEQASLSFSVWRGTVTLRVFQGLLSSVFLILGRGLCLLRFYVSESEGKTHVQVVVDPTQILRLARRFRPFLGLYTLVVRSMFLPMLRRLGKMHMVKLSRMSERDVCLVFSKREAQPLVVVRNRGHRAIPLELMIREASDWYSKFKVAEMMPEFGFDSMKPISMKCSLRGSPN